MPYGIFNVEKSALPNKIVECMFTDERSHSEYKYILDYVGEMHITNEKFEKAIDDIFDKALNDIDPSRAMSQKSLISKVAQTLHLPDIHKSKKNSDHDIDR